MSEISTHVLDNSSGAPAAGIRVTLYFEQRELASAVTDADGRCKSLLPADAVFSPGVYRLVFAVGSYFEHSFYPEVSVSFTVSNPAARHHVPLLISPFGYTTYRGS